MRALSRVQNDAQAVDFALPCPALSLYPSPMPARENTIYCWRYDHPPTEPDDSFIMACRVAVTVAAAEASKTGKTHVVTTTDIPRAIYVVASDHPALSALRM